MKLLFTILATFLFVGCFHQQRPVKLYYVVYRGPAGVPTTGKFKWDELPDTVAFRLFFDRRLAEQKYTEWLKPRFELINSKWMMSFDSVNVKE